MESALGIGMIGAGRICAAHCSAARALPETELVAVADVDPERSAAAAERFAARDYTDYRELLEDPAVDAVVIGLPHWLHLEVTLAALRAGKHVLLEKPMAMSVAECDAMLEAAGASGRVLMVAHSQRYFPVNRAVRQALAAGEIGNLVMATDTWYKPFFEGVRPPWFLDAKTGGGMWPMNGSHMIDRLCYFLDSRVAAVKAKVGSPIFGLPATDMGIAFLEFENGVCATLQHAGYRDGVNRFEAELTGTEGQLRICGDQGGGTRFWRSRDGQWEEQEVPAPEVPLREGQSLPSPVFTPQMREFARAIREGREPEVTGRYARHVVQVMEACEESSRTGRELRLQLEP
ncbi:MAG: Gfo/Idh/MocA family protein [Armatimonadota bacterium]